MKIWRFIWILLLIIILLCGADAIVKWDELKPKLNALYQELTAKEKPVEKIEKKSEPQKEKKPEVALKNKEEKVAKKADKKAEQKETKELTFQVTNISSTGGEISGLAAAGWQVQLSSSG